MEKKLRYYTEKLWNSDLRRIKTWLISKNYETLIYDGKKLW